MAKKITPQIREKISREIEKMMREWKETKKITTSRATYRPKTQEEALKQAARIAYEKYGVSRDKKKKKKK